MMHGTINIKYIGIFHPLKRGEGALRLFVPQIEKLQDVRLEDHRDY